MLQTINQPEPSKEDSELKIESDPALHCTSLQSWFDFKSYHCWHTSILMTAILLCSKEAQCGYFLTKMFSNY